ncbi:DNA-directed RNA polymerase subunit beta [Nocardia sp. NPDC051929]|uniref:DNA-directed RNA polymerase subunit beta n=1 Tax=Nocardia sp. NPDC051929 TaxID=3364327 RepID=UPI0037C5CB99
MGVAWAVIMPATLGQDVKVWMQRHHHALGPIMSHPRSKRWTYLTQPDLPDDITLFAEMFRLNVSLVCAGGTVALPSPADQGTTFRSWVVRPASAFRPAGSVVVAAIRGCVAESIARRKRGIAYA